MDPEIYEPDTEMDHEIYEPRNLGYLRRMRAFLDADDAQKKTCAICSRRGEKGSFPLLVHANGTGCRPACGDCAKGLEPIEGASHLCRKDCKLPIQSIIRINNNWEEHDKQYRLEWPLYRRRR